MRKYQKSLRQKIHFGENEDDPDEKDEKSEENEYKDTFDTEQLARIIKMSGLHSVNRKCPSCGA